MTTETVETAAKPAPKKATARKPAAKKTTAKKASAKKTEKSSLSITSTLKTAGEKVKVSAEKAVDTAKNVVYFQLGVYGKIYDEVNSQVSNVRKEVPKQWDSLVKRGEQVQNDLEKTSEDLQTRVKDFDLKAELKEGADKAKANCQQAFDKVKGFTKKAA